MKRARQTKQIRRLRRRELPIDTVALARFLVGKTLVHDLPHVRLSGRIVETEAYITGDAACHAFRGRTARNGTLFLERGHAYVYFIYGTHFMLNLSSQREGVGEGILLRALEPLEGIEWMLRHRAVNRSRPAMKTSRQRAARELLRKHSARSLTEPSARQLAELARGPGRLAAALRITRSLDGLDLTAKDSPLWLGAAVKPVGEIGVSVRIGINVDAHRLLRFYERGNPHVSGPRRLNP